MLLQRPKRQFSYTKTVAPEVGLEPTTLRLTAACSTIELLRNAAPQYMNVSLRTGLPAVALVALAACSQGGGPTIYSGPSPTAASPSPSGALIRAIWVLSPVGLSLRDNSDSTGKVLATVPQGTQLTATEFRPADPGWYHVTYNGLTGWVAAKDIHSVPPQDLVTSRGQLAYSNPGAGYYFLYPATWNVAENGNDVHVEGPAPNGAASPEPQASGSPLTLGVSAPTLNVHFAPSVDQLGKIPTSPGSILETLDFEVGGITAVKRTYSLSGGGYEGDARVPFTKDHAILITLRSADQKDLTIFTEILESFGFSIRATPSP